MQSYTGPGPFEKYASDMSSTEPAILARLRRETHLKFLYPRMLSSPLQGRLLAMISQLTHPKRILEIGTYTGFSLLCMAEGLAEEGHIDSLEKDPERGWFIRKYMQEAGISERVSLHFGPALDNIPHLHDPYDLVFLDADKANYVAYYDLILPKMNPGGLMMADNVWWFGKVAEPHEQDKETRGLRAFNEYIKQDERVEKVMLPLSDGLTLIRKK